MSEYKFPHGTYKDNMDRFLEQFEDGESFRAQFEIGDLVTVCTKETFYHFLNEMMPEWFLVDCRDFRKEGYYFVPVFNRVRQAAWDAAMKEYFKEKGEWCAKHGCE